MEDYRITGSNPVKEPNNYKIMQKKELECCGSCDEHVGEVVSVKVYDNSYISPWEFNYCEEAIKEDRRRGLMVIILK